MSIQIVNHEAIRWDSKEFEYYIGDCFLEKLIISNVSEGSELYYVHVEFLALGTDHHPNFLLDKKIVGQRTTKYNEMFIQNGQIITLLLNHKFIRGDYIKYNLHHFDSETDCYPQFIYVFKKR